MAFGQAAGPPASHQQLARLAELLEGAGYESFREARHIYGLTQRQAGGKFTRDEADQLLAQLEAGAEGEGDDDPRPAPQPVRTPAARRAAARRAVPAPAPAASDVVLAFPDEMLAEELVRRGWTCTPPP